MKSSLLLFTILNNQIEILFARLTNNNIELSFLLLKLVVALLCFKDFVLHVVNNDLFVKRRFRLLTYSSFSSSSIAIMKKAQIKLLLSRFCV